MSSKLEGRRVAFLVANEGVEQVELTEPWDAVRAAGGETVLVSLEEGHVQAFDHLDKADQYPVDQVVSEASAGEFDALVLPGGVANPDILRADEDAVAFVRAFVDGGKPVAAICHGPWMLVEAGALKGRTLTSWPSIQSDIRNAGGRWVDEQVCIDGDLVTSRKPDDLPAFCDALVDHVARAGAVA